MSRSLASAFLLLAALSPLRAARAQANAAPQQAAQTQAQAGAAKDPQAGAARDSQNAAQDSSAVRVRASHRVEVIAPGEHVETIIDRMRASGGGSATTSARGGTNPLNTERLQVRPPDLTRATDRSGGGDRQHGQGHGPGPGPSGNQNGNGPPSERR